MASSYSRILSKSGAWQFSAAGLIARFPSSMVGLSTILAVQTLYGSYTAAGFVSAANIISVAIGAPLLGRLVDRYGQSKVMLPSTLASVTALLGLIFSAQAHAPLWVLAILAALAGGLGGSMGSLVRSRWSNILDRPDEIHTAFSLEAAADEVAYMVGPVLATALSTHHVLPPTGGWWAALTMQFLGSLWFLSQRRTEPTPHGTVQYSDNAPRSTVLTVPAVRSIVLIFLFTGMMFGANDVSAVAFSDELGRRSMSGTVLAAWATGSMIAALVYGARTWGWPLSKQLGLGVLWLAVGASTFLLAPNLWVLVVLYLLVGFGTAPTITSGNNIVQASVPRAQLTEGLAWISTSLNIGVSLGSLVGGRALDAAGSPGGFTLTAAVAWAAVVVFFVSYRTLRRAKAHATLPH